MNTPHSKWPVSRVSQIFSVILTRAREVEWLERKPNCNSDRLREYIRFSSSLLMFESKDIGL